jgi:hypothetical protein
VGCGKPLPANLRAPAPAPTQATVETPPAFLSNLWETTIRQVNASADLLFPIRSHPVYDFYAGYLPDGRQALVACWPSGKMVMVVFDRDGNLTGVVHDELPTPRQLLEAGDLAAVYDNNYEDYLWREINVEPGLIHVKSCCLPEEEFAIYELPESLLDFQENPNDPNLSEDERNHLAWYLPVWKQHRNFVLVWHSDLWLDGTGEVVAS